MAGKLDGKAAVITGGSSEKWRNTIEREGDEGDVIAQKRTTRNHLWLKQPVAQTSSEDDDFALS